MLHRTAARHIDKVGCLGHACQSDYQFLGIFQRLLHTVVIQRRGYIVGGVILHVTTSSEEKYGDVGCHERRLIARAIAVGRTTDVQVGLCCHFFCDCLELRTRACTRYAQGVVAHTSHHVKVHHGNDTFYIGRESFTLGIFLLHPLNEILGADKSLLFCAEEHEDNTSGRTDLLKVFGQFEYDGISAGIIIGARVYSQGVWTT